MKENFPTPYGYIYLITNKINNKTYIGCRKLSKDNNWRGYMGSGRLIKLAIEKYNKENFTKTLLEYSFIGGEKELKILEDKWIAYYKSINKAEYNIYNNSSAGGDTFSKLKNKTIEEVKLSQRIGINKAISEGRGSARIKSNNIIKYEKIFKIIGEVLLKDYENGLTLLECHEKYNIPLGRIRGFLKNSNILRQDNKTFGRVLSETTKNNIKSGVNSKIILKSGESLHEAHDRLIKYNYRDLISGNTLKNIYIELNVSKGIFNRFIRDHNISDCSYCDED